MSRSSRIRGAVSGLRAPRAPKHKRSFVVHGYEHVDEYAYLRDSQRASTCKYIAAESMYFDNCMAAVSDLQETLRRELTARIIENDSSVPETIRGYRYYTRVEAGQQYPLHCRVLKTGGIEQVYLDENRVAADSSYCEISIVSICPRHEMFAYAVDRTGNEKYDVLAVRFSDGKTIRCADAAGDSLAWSGTGTVLLYTGTDANARPDSVWLYDLLSGERRLVYREPDPAFHVTVWLSRCDRWILIDSGSNTSSETWAIPASDPRSEPQLVVPRHEDVEYAVEPHEDRFLILTNDEAENFRLISVPLPQTEGDVQELIAGRDDVVLDFVDSYKHHLVVGERRDGIEYAWVWDLETDSKCYLPGTHALSSHDVEDLFDYEARYVRYEYSTPTSPHAVYDYLVSKEKTVRRKQTVPPGYEENDYASERLLVPTDGVEVPITLIYKRDAKSARRSGAPLLLTGYGAYEESQDMEFDSDLISLLDRGVVVATAHVRGGGELGPAWHDAGCLSAKENSFRDFIACARYLVDHQYTEPGLIAAWGASAGGLLVAVAVQRHPYLFASVVLEVPFLDVINTLLDPGLPLTVHDFDEFGDPSVEEEYQWLRAYCPYHNIRPAAYPPMLVTAAMNDRRVGYWEALKWTARIRCSKTDDNPLLLKIDSVGHFGESGRYESANNTAIVYTFLLDTWGLGDSVG